MPTISDGAAFLLVGVGLWLVPFLGTPRGFVTVRHLFWPALACFVLAAVMPWGRAGVWGSWVAQFALWALIFGVGIWGLLSLRRRRFPRGRGRGPGGAGEGERSPLVPDRPLVGAARQEWPS